MLEGVTARESTNQKDEIVIEGNDIDKVSQSAASIHGSCLVKQKDVSLIILLLVYYLCGSLTPVALSDSFPHRSGSSWT